MIVPNCYRVTDEEVWFLKLPPVGVQFPGFLWRLLMKCGHGDPHVGVAMGFLLSYIGLKAGAHRNVVGPKIRVGRVTAVVRIENPVVTRPFPWRRQSWLGDQALTGNHQAQPAVTVER